MQNYKSLPVVIILVVVLGTGLAIWGVSALFNSQKTLTNRQIIEQSDYCYKHGYSVETYGSGLTGETVKIECGKKLK